jgi:HlyD family secretion protein
MSFDDLQARAISPTPEALGDACDHRTRVAWRGQPCRPPAPGLGPPIGRPGVGTLALLLLLLLPLLAACGEDQPDAYGNFEADEVVVSTEVGGSLQRFDVERGERLVAGAVVARVDTIPLALQRDEFAAQRQATHTRTTEAEAQIDVLEAQLATASEEYQRTRRLYDAQAATARQLNQSEGEVQVLRQRIEAARAQTGVVRQEAGGADARIRQIEDRIARSTVRNPIAGTVLTTYVEAGELVQAGAPLYRIADTDTLTLRAYVSGAQLADVRLGEAVDVQVDAGEDELLSIPGRVVWIASEAEFTPTPIQTREERTEQVYAVEIRVPNTNGLIKIGMPGEVLFGEASDDELDRSTSRPGNGVLRELAGTSAHPDLPGLEP